MKDGWTRIYSSPDVLKVKIVEDVLKQNGIESHILDKPNSAIPSIGDASLYTPNEKAEAALKVLAENDID